MKITIRSPKPRNPLIAPALMRLAGKHQRSGGSSRQHAGRQLQRELQQFVPPRHSP